jgi:hypothetical protein
MSAKSKLFYAYVSGSKVYTHAANMNQAATAIGNKTKRMIQPQQVKEVKPMYVYTFARKTSEFDKTSYEECLAKSEKQAWFYFNKSRGKQWFARIDSIRLASKDDLKELVEGVLKDVTW